MSFRIMKADDGRVVPDPGAADPAPAGKPARKPRKVTAVSRPSAPYKLPGGVPPVIVTEVDVPMPGQTSFLPEEASRA